MDSVAEGIIRRYALGELTVAGDTRYLSGDLLELLWRQVDKGAKRNRSQETFFSVAMTNTFPTTAFYAPGARYAKDRNYTILRNPHIARNEEIQLAAYRRKDNMRHYYLGHLHDVIMVDPHMLAAERLGGADYDGDMVRTIASPLLNQCVRRNYYEYSDKLANTDNLPLLMIPTIEPLIRDANDWEARYETVKNTFSARTGQISNAALNRSIQAYNENSTAEDRDRYRKEVEMLAILTGLEIDSSKSGVKPDLSEYLGAEDVQRSRFLRYKYIAAEDDRGTRPSQATKKKRLDAYFSSVDWDKVDSNIEQLQNSIFNLNTKGGWVFRFDDAIAEALELGPLENYEIALPEELKQRVVQATSTKAAPYVCDLISYYLAHRREDTDWVVLPATGFDNYYRSSYFSKKVLGAIPETILVRQERSGISRYCITDAYLP